MYINNFDNQVLPYLSSKELAKILFLSKSIREKSMSIHNDSTEDYSKSWATEIICKTHEIDNIIRN